MQDVYNTGVVLKIHAGTEREDFNLCATCRNCHTYIEARTGEKNVRCFANYQHPLRLTGPIARCNLYSDATRPTLDQMQQIAWQLMTNKSNKAIGFLSPEELQLRGTAQAPASLPGFGR